MRVFGSLTNRLQESAKPETPVVGMGATLLFYSDRDAATIIEVSEDGKQIKLQEDHCIRTDKNGMSESQDYRYEPNIKGKTHVATLRKNGTYVLVGGTLHSGTVVRVGDRDAYHDYSF